MRSCLLALLAFSVSLHAQTAATTRPVARPTPAVLKPYTGCKLPGGPDVLQSEPLPHAPMQRAAQTLTGPKKLTIADGMFTAYGYTPGTPFTNVKVELLPAASYATEKADIISEFDAINAKGENTQRNYSLPSMLHGFEIYGFDRTSLRPQDRLLGMYLFFDNTHHIATTAYFLNAAAGQRHFNNVEEYSGLRDGFLNAYTVCVRKALSGTPAGKPHAIAAKATPAHKARH